MKNKYIVGVYDDEDSVKVAVKGIQDNGIKIHNVFTPYPVHGLHHIFKVPRSRLPIAAFCFGSLGLSCAFLMMWYMITYDWPMDIGGKPNFPVVSFIPISFELTVLFASFGMGFVFMCANKLFPGREPDIFDERATDNKFIIAINIEQNKSVDIESIVKKTSASEINIKEV